MSGYECENRNAGTHGVQTSSPSLIRTSLARARSCVRWQSPGIKCITTRGYGSPDKSNQQLLVAFQELHQN